MSQNFFGPLLGAIRLFSFKGRFLALNTANSSTVDFQGLETFDDLGDDFDIDDY